MKSILFFYIIPITIANGTGRLDDCYASKMIIKSGNAILDTNQQTHLDLFFYSAFIKKKNNSYDSLSLLKGKELRKKVKAAVKANISFKSAENFVGQKAMYPGTDSAAAWFNNLVTIRIIEGDLPKGDMSYEYKYLLRWDCKEVGKKGLPIVTGIFWDKNMKSFYFEGWIYPP